MDKFKLFHSNAEKAYITPRSIRSRESIQEINDLAQARLEARRKNNLRMEHYLFGSPRKYKYE